MNDLVRVIRVIEYVGTREWLDATLENCAVPVNGEKVFGHGMIRSAILGEPNPVDLDFDVAIQEWNDRINEED